MIAAWVCAAGLQSGQPFPPPTEEELAGHRRMLELLEKVRADTPRLNAYLGDAALKKVERALAELDPSAPAKTRARLEFDQGKELLRLGRNEEALASLERCHERLSAFPPEEWPPFAERLYYDLGLVCMRKGETDNCVARHTAQSCLLPIAGDGVHADQAGSRAAMRWFRAAMESSPPDGDIHVCARWLLNIAAMTVGEYPEGLSAEERIDPAVYAAEAEFPRFRDVAPELGLACFDLSGGAVLEDLDNDGRLDVLSSSWDTSKSLRYFVNRGDGSFIERSAEANLTGLYGGLNLLQADYDGDGWTDVFVLRGAWLFGPRGQIPRSLLQNRGGSFLDVTIRAGLNEEFYPSQAGGFADYDLDGDLDLYVGSEANADSLFPGQLFQNQGDGTFRDVAEAAGVENVRFCKGVSWGDYDGDRYPDLYTSNLNSKNRLYHNQGDGTFQDVAEELGVTRPLMSFPAWFFDFDNDGALDIFVSSYNLVDPQASLRLAPVARSYLGLSFDAELACLYRGDGHGGFTEVAVQKNIKRLTMPMGANFGDLDNDGFLDIYLGTGYPAYDGLIPNVMYWNRRGERFLDVTAAGGFGHLQKGHGVAFGDLDDDGDQDVFEQMGGAYPGDAFGNLLYENPGFGQHWLELELTGKRSNRSAIGTRIRADFEEDGKLRSVYRWVGSGGSFGCNPLAQHLGLGRAGKVVRLEIYWPRSGTTQVFTDVPVDVRLEIEEGAAEHRLVREEPFRLGG
jgi:tetratricopeptide (TPR) repeat protein